MASNIVLSTQEFEVVGPRPIRYDGTDKVTGRVRYGADINLPRMLHGKVLRSPHPHALVKSIDASRALTLDGVKAVVTGTKLPEVSDLAVGVPKGSHLNMRFASDNCLARDKVLYKGHGVAAVGATGTHIAQQALGLIDVQYELPPGSLTCGKP